MKGVILISYWVLAILFIGYVALWVGLIEPIMNIGEMIDADTVTATAVGWEIIKIFLREIVTGFVARLVYGIGILLTGTSIYTLRKKRNGKV